MKTRQVFVFIGILVLVALIIYLLNEKSNPMVPIAMEETEMISDLTPDEDISLLAYGDFSEKMIYVAEKDVDIIAERYNAEIQGDQWLLPENGTTAAYAVADISDLDMKAPVEGEDFGTLEGMICKVFTKEGVCVDVQGVNGGFKYSMKTPKGGLAWCTSSPKDTCDFTKKEYTGNIWNVAGCPDNVQPIQATKIVRICMDDRN